MTIELMAACNATAAAFIKAAQGIVWLGLVIVQFATAGFTAVFVAWAAVWFGYWIATHDSVCGWYFAETMLFAVLCFVAVILLSVLRSAAMGFFRRLFTRVTGVALDEPFCP